MNFKVILGGLALSLIGWIVIKSQGQKIEQLTGDKKQLSSTVSTQSIRIVELRQDSASLAIKNGKLSVQVAEQKTANERVTSEALTAALKLQETRGQLVAVSNTLKAKEAKQKADANVGGVGAVNTTEADTTLNRQIATLKSEIAYYEGYLIPSLNASIATLKGEKSDLERVINGPDGKDAQINGLVTKIQEVKTLVQQKRAEAKGIFARKRNRVLGEIDSKITPSTTVK